MAGGPRDEDTKRAPHTHASNTALGYRAPAISLPAYEVLMEILLYFLRVCVMRQSIRAGRRRAEGVRVQAGRPDTAMSTGTKQGV